MRKLRDRISRRLGLLNSDGTRNAERQEVLESLLSGVVLQLLLLVTGIAAARALGDEGRGQQALIYIVALAASQIVLLGLPLSLTYEAARGHHRAQRLLNHLAPVAFAQTVLVFVVFCVLMFLVFSDRVPVSAALVTLPALPSIIWQAYGLATIQGHHQFRALHFFRLTPPALYTVGLVVTLLVFQQSVTAVMAAWSISYVVGAAGTQIFIQVDARRNPHKEPEGGPSRLPDRTKMFRFGAIAFLGASSPLEVFRVDQLAVGLVLTTVDLALYTTALSFCNFPRFLTLALGLNAYARISAIKTVEQQNRLIIRYFLVGITSAALVSAPLALFAAPLINLTFGPEFSDATTITQLLLGATVLLCGRRILSDCLRGAGLPGAGSVAEITSLVALVPAALIFVPPYGLTGFGLAMITSYMAGLIAICVYSARGWNRELSSDRPS